MLFSGQTRGNKWAPIHYIIPVKWYGGQTPLKVDVVVFLIPNKIHHKTVQSNTLWLKFNKIDWINILQSADRQGKPSFHIHAQGSKSRDTHALEQHRLSQNTPICSSFLLVIASDMHLESGSEKQAENIDFQAVKNVQKPATLSQLFVEEFL